MACRNRNPGRVRPAALTPWTSKQSRLAYSEDNLDGPADRKALQCGIIIHKVLLRATTRLYSPLCCHNIYVCCSKETRLSISGAGCKCKRDTEGPAQQFGRMTLSAWTERYESKRTSGTPSADYEQFWRRCYTYSSLLHVSRFITSTIHISIVSSLDLLS